MTDNEIETENEVKKEKLKVKKTIKKDSDESKKNANEAQKFINFVKKNFGKEIDFSVDNTISYDHITGNKYIGDKNSEIILIPNKLTDIVFTHANPNSKIAVLNLANFTSPGGRYLIGYTGPEEEICSKSTLFPVLYSMQEYYLNNDKQLNNGFYFDRGLYSPNIVFVNGDQKVLADIISCPAPNWSVAKRKFKDEKEANLRNLRYLRNRIKFILDMAADNKVGTLLLGTLGWDNAKQNPLEVAKIFKEALDNEYKGVFDKVVFSLPNEKSYLAFNDTFKK